ncbi:MAG: hypothetical protein Q7T82_04795 [Armatimonadota bacterium]|nr:hypothetical protein [Armatimonadota bacterium]
MGGALSLAPLAMGNAATGGTAAGLQQGIKNAFGLNNIGLLVATFGKFTYVDPTTFTLDDGSGANVKCMAPTGVSIQPGWKYVAVTGISSCEKVGAGLHRLLRVRCREDIVPLLAAP